MGGAQHGGDALVLAHCRSRPAQRWEQVFRQAQLFDQPQVKFSGFGVHQPGGGGVGILLRLYAGELPQQILRHHEEIGDPCQPSLLQIYAELINGVERLELATDSGVELLERNVLVNRRDQRFRSVVPVGVTGPDLLVPFEQDVIAPPGVDGKAVQRAEFVQRLVNACPDVSQQGVHVPSEVAIPLCDPVGETVDLFCLDCAALAPAHDVTPRRRADVDG